LKNVYVILAFHAHELLWDLPEKLLSYLDGENPMKETITEENYLKKRKQQGRDIYSLCSELGDRLQAPMCVEYSNELLVQVRDVLPEVFERLKKDYGRNRLYPIYGHAHHTHVSLLKTEEMTQEILWNQEYLHNVMRVPYPKYQGLFPVEDSLDTHKLAGMEQANIDYVIFPHLEEGKVPFQVKGKGDYIYRPFVIRAPGKDIIALPRNFPISQEIWRPITKMKRDAVKFQGYMLGDFPVFDNEYLGEKEDYPITREQGTAFYKQVLLEELEKCPDGGLLLYVQDLELMDFGDIALAIMEEAWLEILKENQENYRIHFVTPDSYLDQVDVSAGLEHLPVVEFNKISWAPEIRLILRTDGHYPPLGVTGVAGYGRKKTGLYHHPHIFWENGKYYCGIFDTLMQNFHIAVNVPVNVEKLGKTGYDLARESLDAQAVLYLRLMKRACNWGWRPTEGRQKRPCLKGYLLCAVLLEKLHLGTVKFNGDDNREIIDDRNFVGLCETLKVFIDSRVNYLRFGLESYEKEKGGDWSQALSLFDRTEKWKEKALKHAQSLYQLNQAGLKNMEEFLRQLQEYAQAVYMATDYIQQIWGAGPDAEYLVGKMYHYLYRLYPPLFPEMVDRIDAMEAKDIKNYFNSLNF